MKLPICQALIQIKRNPTMWLSPMAARDWVSRVIADRSDDMTLEEAFQLHDETFGPKVKASSLACPAGDPCPATGCPACCPDYDPCGKPECVGCRNRKRAENVDRTIISDVHERAFWGIHRFRESPDILGCTLCGWGYQDPIHRKEKTMHVPEETDLPNLAEAEKIVGVEPEWGLEECGWVVQHATPETPDEYCGEEVPPGQEYCGKHQRMAAKMIRHEGGVGDPKPEPQLACKYHCFEDQVNYPECPVHGISAEAGVETPLADSALKSGLPISRDHEPLPHSVTVVIEKIREAYAAGNGPENILAFPIGLLNELCNLATQYPHPDGDGMVLGPEIFAGPNEEVISWKGQNYYKRVPTDKDRELIAKNAKATIERRDKERAERLLRETAMHHAVELHKAGLSAGNIPTRSITQSADDILEWLNKS